MTNNTNTKVNTTEEKKEVKDFFADVLGLDTKKIDWKKLQETKVYGRANNRHYGWGY